MKKSLFIFKNGMRTTSEGNIMIAPPGDDVPQELDLSEATPEEFAQIRRNPHDSHLIQRVRSDIRNRK